MELEIVSITVGNDKWILVSASCYVTTQSCPISSWSQFQKKDLLCRPMGSDSHAVIPLPAHLDLSPGAVLHERLLASVGARPIVRRCRQLTAEFLLGLGSQTQPPAKSHLQDSVSDYVRISVILDNFIFRSQCARLGVDCRCARLPTPKNPELGNSGR